MPDIVIFIPSRPGNADERAAVRETWGFHAKLCGVRIVFGVGSGLSEREQRELSVENTVYADILQTAEARDSYHNQTRMILSFFQWGIENCVGT